MSISVVDVYEDDHAKSWRKWQLSNELVERKRAKGARLGFTLAFVAVAVWVGTAVLMPMLERF